MSDDPRETLARGLAALAASTGDLEAHLTLLEAAVQLRAYDLIEAVTQRLIAGGVDDPRFLGVWAIALERLGRREEELAVLDQLIARDATPRWLVARAEAQDALGRHAAAMDDLDRALAMREDDRALCLRAKVRAENGRFDEARADLRRAAALGASPARLELACLGVTSGALHAFAFDVATQALDEGLELAPTAYLHLFRAKIRHDLGDAAGARADVAAATALDAELVAVETAPDGDFAMLESPPAPRLRGVPMSPEALTAIGRAMQRMDRDDPTGWLELLSQESIEGPMGHWFRGRAALQANQPEVAVRELSAARALLPDHGDLGETCVRALVALGDEAPDAGAAAAHYRRALAELDALEALPWVTYQSRLLRAIVLNRLEADGADPILDALIDERPEEPEAWTIRGAIRAFDDVAAARADLEVAARLGSRFAAELLQRLGPTP